MKPLRPAAIPSAQRIKTMAAILKRWQEGDAEMRQCFPAADPDGAAVLIGKYLRRMLNEERIFMNDVYQVNVRDHKTPVGDMVHLSIKRIDRQPIHDFRDLQAIKNQLVGPECEAVELYPAESRLVDSANQYHLWAVADPAYRFPFGFEGIRMVTDKPLADSVNRPFEQPV